MPSRIVEDQFGGEAFKFWWSAGGGASLVSGRARLACSSAYTGALTSDTFSTLAGSTWTVEAPVLAQNKAGTETFFHVEIDENNELRIQVVEAGKLKFREEVGGSVSITETTYNATTHKWWRIVVDDAGTVLWQTSEDGEAWTTRREKASAIPLDESARVRLRTGNFNGEELSPAYTEFDNLTVDVEWEDFTADAESGDFSDFANVQAPAERTSVVTDPVRQGERSYRFQLQPGDEEPETGNERAEAISGRKYTEGDKRYFRDLILIEEWDDAHWGLLGQIRINEGTNPPVSWQIDPISKKLLVCHGNGEDIYWEGPTLEELTGEWFELVIEVLFHPSEGTVQVWFNGTEQEMLEGTGIATMGEVFSYDKIGTYRSEECTEPSDVYHDDYRVTEAFFSEPEPRERLRKRRKPPLELDLEVETPDGFFRFAADDPKARNRFTGLGFSTARGDGFTTGQGQLARPIFSDYPDVQLLSTIRAIGRGGDVAYEGRLHSNPRTNDPFQQIALQVVGWMTYLKGRKIAPLIIDRRLSGWQEASTQRKANQVVAGARYADGFTTGRQDTGTKGPGLVMKWSRFDGTYTELNEAWFYAGGEPIASIKIGAVERLVGEADASFQTLLRLSTDDIRTESDDSSDLNYGNTTNASQTTEDTDKLYAVIQSQYEGAFAADGNNVLAFLNPRIVGTHGLTERGEAPEEGYYLSDMIEYLLSTYYPKVEWAGQSNTFPVQHATWHDNPQDGWSIMQELNNLALWETNVWEGPKLYFQPADLTVHNWQIHTDQKGVSVEFQGDSVENFANGVAVTYTDFSGVQRTLYPPDHEELRDDSESNPYNKQNEYGWIPDGVTVPFPCLEAEALQFGRAYLAEYNRPKRVGQYRVTGHIEDSAGNWHPVWKVRNSETILVLDHPSDEPRLIYATDYDHDSRTVTITVDAPSKLLDAVVARQERARTARNLT